MSAENYSSLPLGSEKVNKLIEETLNRKSSVCCQILNYIIQSADNSFMPDHELVKGVKSIKMISFRRGEDDFEMSYLPIGKVPEYNEDGTWKRKNRQTGKIGKTFRTFILPYIKVLGFDEPSQADIEEFVNDVKHFLGEVTYEFKLVKGEDISRYYNEKSYYHTSNGGGTLWCSCMRHEECADYFGIYETNPNCELLIMFDKSLSTNKIVGRALVWTKDGKKYLDRRYYCLDVYNKSMINYAIDQGWCYKTYNTYDDAIATKFSFSEEGVIKDVRVVFNYKYDCSFDKFPYSDTIKFWSDSDRTLSNVSSSYCYKLDDTEGDYSEIDDDYSLVTCCVSGDTIHEEYAVWISRSEEYCREEYAVRDLFDEWILETRSVQAVIGNNGNVVNVDMDDLEECTIIYNNVRYIRPKYDDESPIFELSELTTSDVLHETYEKINETYGIHL